jgi:hypothetical protein
MLIGKARIPNKISFPFLIMLQFYSNKYYSTKLLITTEISFTEPDDKVNNTEMGSLLA